MISSWLGVALKAVPQVSVAIWSSWSVWSTYEWHAMSKTKVIDNVTEVKQERAFAALIVARVGLRHWEFSWVDVRSNIR